MPTLDGVIKKFVAGDDLSIRRTIDRDGDGETDFAMVSGVTVSRAWLTVKDDLANPDPGLVQKEITTSNVPGTGQIENNGTGDVDPVLRFDLTPANTIAIGTKSREYDVQVLLSNGKIYTPERGRIFATSQVTLDVS